MARIDEHIIILEGCDGAGKTTLATKIAGELGCAYRHLEAFPNIGRGDLGRFYLEAASPALLGYQSVVMDRSWISEIPYSLAYREGAARLTRIHANMLERVFRRCQVSLILCHPPWETCLSNWSDRKNRELLKESTQLRRVYDWYDDLKTTPLLFTGFNPIVYDYTKDSVSALINQINANHQTWTVWDLPVVGEFSDRSILLVGDDHSNHMPQDSYYRYPFVSFSDAGPSHFVTTHLATKGILESDVCWTNTRSVGEVLKACVIKKGNVIALGTYAATVLKVCCGLSPNKDFVVIEHPQQIIDSQPINRYELADTIRRLIAERDAK